MLRQVAEAHHATPSQIALAWLIRRPNVVVIPGASSAAQVEVNAAAADIELTDGRGRGAGGRVRRLRAVGGDAVLPDLIRERLSSWFDRIGRAGRVGRAGRHRPGVG